MDLISTLTKLQNAQDPLCVAYMFLAALALRHSAILPSRNLSWITISLGALVIGVYLIKLASYLLYPNFADHVEATVASISWLGMHGREFYPNWMVDDVYGLVYGPVLYLVQGLLLLIVPTITALKIMGVVSLLLAFVLTFMVVKHKVADSNLTPFFTVASVVMLIMPLSPFAYWTRADPFLILISVCALLAAVTLNPVAAGAIIGVLAGLATGLKVHGFIYVAPLAIMTLGRAAVQRDRFVVAIVGVACAIIVILLPFCLKQSSLVGYLHYLRVAALHRFAFEENLLFAAALFAPIIAVWFWCKPVINPPELWLLGGLGISLATAVLIGGVSGPYHLLPFVPICLYCAIAILPTKEARRVGPIIFSVFLLAYGPGFLLDSRIIKFYFDHSSVEREKVVELQTYLDNYPDSQVGISDGSHYFDANYRIFSVLRGHPLHIDFAAWEDLAYVGVDEKTIVRFIETCEVPTWILPLGTPFTKLSWYTKHPILSDDFRRIFSTNYKLIQTGEFYQVWKCRSSAEKNGAKLN